MRIDCGIVRATTVAPARGRRRRRRELVLVVAGRAHAEHVPVERAARRDAQVDHEVDLGLGESVEAAGDDELELRAGMRPEDRREGDQLVT